MSDKTVYINLRPLAAEKSIFKVAMSDRSDGKTTGAVWLSVESFDECGKSATFCRRYGTEMTDLFFDQIEKALKTRDKYGVWQGIGTRDFDIKKPSKKDGVGRLLLQPLDSDQKQTAITFCPLSKAARLKSAFDYATHRHLFIDEYVPLDGRYLPREAEAILELYRTIDRNHFDNYVMICTNRITIHNPVFDYFGITKWKNGANTYKNGAFSLLCYHNKGNARLVENSPFNDLIKGTAYEAYASGGGFLRTNNALLKQYHSKLALCYVAHDGRLFGLYQSENDAVFDVARGNMPAPVVCVEPQAAAFGATWLQAAPEIRALLASYKYENKIFFADETILNNLRKVYAAI